MLRNAKRYFKKLLANVRARRKKLPPLYSYPIWEDPIRLQIWRRLGNFTPHQFGGRLSWDRRPYSDGAGLHVDGDNTLQIPADMFGDALRGGRLIENAHLFTSITSKPKGFSKLLLLNAQSLRAPDRSDRSLVTSCL
ncbi:hypothetical protein HNY73_010372 [Argiope bruennichi]|uniref:Uncharacterized protein n=1 Tax=Argiope bruennichi TaxID=94029 RepID=A0A8T0F366_ARGBR|nr:hypothetical protein HNY73_010372 [Argiope bruennichi]